MFNRITKYAIKNILRNKFLSLSSLLVLTLLMFFINILFVLHDVSFRLIDSISSKLTISLYLDEEYSENSLEVIDLLSEIKELTPSVKVEYKTKEDILDEIRIKEPDLVQILERENPLPDTISLSDIDLDEYELVNSAITKRSFVLSKDDLDAEYFANYNTQYKKIKSVISVLNTLQGGLYVVIAIFFISISIIIYSVIGNFIYYFRDEIYITKLVGGSNIFINGPFVVQGILYSIAGSIISYLIFTLAVSRVNNAFGDTYFISLNLEISLLQMLVFIIIGGASGFFSSRKYLGIKN